MLLSTTPLLFATAVNVAAALSMRTLASRAPEALDAEPEGVTVLKPLCGLDAGLADNLRSFFAQDHPRFELLFGVEGEDDPAVSVVKMLMREHPHVRARLVIHRGSRGINPKVSNLRATLEARPPSYDLLLISDSNARVLPSYVRQMHAVMRAQDAGLVCSLVTGVDDRTLGATLDNSAMNSDVSPSLALLNLARIHPAVLGKSMLFRRSVFEALGGFESVASLLAEDYVIGRMFAEAGYRVAIAPERVRSPIVDSTVRSFVQRQLRWAAMRWKLAPSSSISEPLTRPLGALLLALAMGAPLALACAWAAALMVVRDGYFHCASRGRRGLGRALVSAPLRELLSLWVALAAPFVRDVCWRNKRVRLSAGTRLYVRPARPIRRRHPSPT